MQAKVKDMNPLFFDILLQEQMHYKHILNPSVPVAEEFSLSCLLRCGTTTQARIMKVPKEVIAANNCWRREAAAQGRTPAWSIFEQYSNVKANDIILSEFSWALYAQCAFIWNKAVTTTI